MALTTSIQRGTETILAADGATIDITISAVTVADCIVFLTERNEDSAGRDQRHTFEVSLTSTTNLRLVRQDSGFATDIVVEWIVVELDSSAYTSLQSGIENTGASTAIDVTISSVTPGDCSTFYHHSTDENNALLAAGAALAEITSATNLRFSLDSAPAAGDFRASWWGVEWNTANIGSVQSGIIALAGGAGEEASDTATISSVDTGKSAIVHQGLSGNISSAVYSRSRVMVVLTNATTVTASRSVLGTTPTINVSFSVVEFASESVVSGTANFLAAETSENPTFTELGADHVVVGSWGPWNNFRASGSADFDVPDESVFSMAVSSPPDDIVIARTTAADVNEDGDVAWFVIDFTAAVAGDPESRLIGGKLLSGGLLIKGTLV